MKHLKQNFSLKACVQVDRGQNSTFSDYVNVAYQIKGND